MARTLPPSLAPIVEELELAQPVVVTTSTLHRMVEDRGIATPAHVVIQRLAERGWLLPTGVRGAWEFAPGSHAGAYSRGDPFLTLRAQRAVVVDLPARVALGSALWKLGLADRAPSPHEVSFPEAQHVPVAIARAYRVVRFTPVLPAEDIGGLPVDRPETVLVHLVDAPSDVRTWGEILDLLPDLVDRIQPDAVKQEIERRAHATKVRLGYLLDAVAPELIAELGVEPATKVWFGPRGPLRRHDATWNVADTILPHHPRERGSRSWN